MVSGIRSPDIQAQPSYKTTNDVGMEKTLVFIVITAYSKKPPLLPDFEEYIHTYTYAHNQICTHT